MRLEGGSVALSHDFIVFVKYFLLVLGGVFQRVRGFLLGELSRFCCLYGMTLWRVGYLGVLVIL